jgi:FkbM family methyltransferase
MLGILKRLKNNYNAYGYRGTLFAAKSRILLPHSEVKVKPPCCPTPLILRTRSTDVTTYNQIFINSEYDVDLAKTPRIIIDAGANIGCTSLYFACKYPQAKILAIEPELTNYSLLCKNIQTYPNIVAIRAALWKSNSEIDITDPGDGHWGFRTYAQTERHHNSILDRVPGITVDQLLIDYMLEHIDILKVDIEGAEKEVFEDVNKWIEKVGVVMIELHERFKPGCTMNVMHATKGFDFEYKNGETLFLARNNYVPIKSLKTNWQARAIPI